MHQSTQSLHFNHTNLRLVLQTRLSGQTGYSNLSIVISQRGLEGKEEMKLPLRTRTLVQHLRTGAYIYIFFPNSPLNSPWLSSTLRGLDTLKGTNISDSNINVFTDWYTEELKLRINYLNHS